MPHPSRCLYLKLRKYARLQFPAWYAFPMYAARLRVVPAPPMPMPSEAEAGVAWIRYVPLRIIEGEADAKGRGYVFTKGGLLPPNPLALV